MTALPLPDALALQRCPRCMRRLVGRYPAVSRTDDRTRICSPCGNDEALHDLVGSPYGARAFPLIDWPIDPRLDLSSLIRVADPGLPVQ